MYHKAIFRSFFFPPGRAPLFVSVMFRYWAFPLQADHHLIHPLSLSRKGPEHLSFSCAHVSLFVSLICLSCEVIHLQRWVWWKHMVWCFLTKETNQLNTNSALQYQSNQYIFTGLCLSMLFTIIKKKCYLPSNCLRIDEEHTNRNRGRARISSYGSQIQIGGQLYNFFSYWMGVNFTLPVVFYFKLYRKTKKLKINGVNWPPFTTHGSILNGRTHTKEKKMYKRPSRCFSILNLNN